MTEVQGPLSERDKRINELREQIRLATAKVHRRIDRQTELQKQIYALYSDIRVKQQLLVEMGATVNVARGIPLTAESQPED